MAVESLAHSPKKSRSPRNMQLVFNRPEPCQMLGLPNTSAFSYTISLVVDFALVVSEFFEHSRITPNFEFVDHEGQTFLNAVNGLIAKALTSFRGPIPPDDFHAIMLATTKFIKAINDDEFSFKSPGDDAELVDILRSLNKALFRFVEAKYWILRAKDGLFSRSFSWNFIPLYAVGNLLIWWEQQVAERRDGVALLKAANGPECNGRRTQFLKRMVDLADHIGKPI